MKNVTVEILAAEAKNYPIIIGKNLLQNLGGYVKNHSRADKILIITNETIYPLFADIVKASLESQELHYEFVILPDGEK